MIGNVLRILLMILLGILKFIGWTILIILLLIVFLLFFISVNPFRYSLDGNLKENIKESGGKAQVSWLWKLIKVGGIYEDHEFRTFLDLPFKKKKQETKLEDAEDFAESQIEKAAEKAGDIPQELTQAVTEVISEESSPAPEEESINEAADFPEEISDVDDEDPFFEMEEDEISAEEKSVPEEIRKPEETPSSESRPVFESVSAQSQNVSSSDTTQAEECDTTDATEQSSKAEQIRDKLEELAVKVILRFTEIHTKAVETKAAMDEKADHLSRKADPILAAIRDEKNQKTVKHILHEVFSLIGKLLPKDLDLNFVYSAGSPDITGLIYGFVFMFPEGYKREWYIEPDFESDHFYIQGDVSISGAIYIGSVFILLFRILFAPCVWHTVFSALRVLKAEKRISREIAEEQKMKDSDS